MNHVGKRLRHFRKNLRMTQEELAEGICNRSYVSQIEKGNVIPSPEILEQLAKRLQTDLRELWSETETPVGFNQVEIQNALRHIVNRIEANDWEIARKWVYKLSGTQLNPADKSIFLWAKGEIAQNDQRFEEVEPLYRSAILLSREGDDPVVTVRALQSLGYFYCMTRQPKKAIPHLNEALQLVTRFEISGLLRISLLYTSAMMHGNLEEYFSAIELLNQAVQLNQAYGTMYKSAMIFMGLAICHLHIKEYEKAEKYNLQALEVFKLNPNDRQEGNTYTNLAILYRVIGKYEKAEEFLNRSIEIHQKMSNRHWTINATNELAQLYKHQGRYREAKELLESIIEKATTEHFLAEINLNYATVLNELDEVDQALIHLEKSLEFFTRHQIKHYVIKAYRELVNISIKSNDKEAIARIYEKYDY
ncbi:tetratricopeptide repeat protein [Brevibacillus dissolubilis]|uniref:tetratricopeptide repeat protein n=1 Tax=Brevibacillus dissolubilis TaxID=1844116 RepID=UPI0011169AEA|nr:tetratricopeptide repeat protein [Brevibacillus dissolubilis]